jgi:hypothetical protein
MQQPRVRMSGRGKATGFHVWTPYEVFYIHSMLFNTASAIKSIQYLARCSKNPALDAFSVGDKDVLDNVQNIVVQAAAISRYFWPVRKGREARAQLLCAACGVKDESTLKNRDLRNSIEHFDEKLDEYLADGIAGYIFPEYVGPEVERAGAPTHIFRAYYTNTGIFELLGKRYNIAPIADEINRVHHRLQQCDASGGRLLPLDKQ